MRVAEEHVGNASGSQSASDSLPLDIGYAVASWVRPGIHSLDSNAIINQRNLVTDDGFLDLMTPYFVRHEAVREGMLKLRKLFVGPGVRDNNGYSHRAPQKKVSYDEVLSILLKIYDGIDPEKDPYPDERNIKDARTRYQNYLVTGNRMPLMAKDQDEDTIGVPGSNKRKAVSQGDIYYVKDKKLKSGDKLWGGRATVTTGGRGRGNRG